MFQVLIEMRLVQGSPGRQMKGLHERDGERQVYISQKDFKSIVENLPGWVPRIVQTLYYTGMRRGEALGLTWGDIDLDARIIRLSVQQTKERKSKRVPIQEELVQILEPVKGKKIQSFSSRVFSLTTRITTHYSAPELENPIAAVNKVCPTSRHKMTTLVVLKKKIRQPEVKQVSGIT